MNKLKQTVRTVIVSILMVTGMVLYAAPVSADCTPDASKGVSCCGGTQTSIISCDQTNKGSDISNNGVWGLLLIAINIMTAGIAVAAIGGLVYASILYATAEQNSAQVTKAKTMIFNTVTGLVVFAVMWSLLQFLIPGGIFKP